MTTPEHMRALEDEATFLSAFAGIGDRHALAESCLATVRAALAESPAPWADTHPNGTALYLLDHGGQLDRIAEYGADFELTMRAIYGLAHRRFPETFDEFAAWLDTVIQGADA